MKFINNFGIEPEQQKQPALSRAYEAFRTDGFLVVPMLQKGAQHCEVVVQRGDRIRKFQPLGIYRTGVACPVLSPASGRVADIREIFHPYLENQVNCVVLEVDLKNKSHLTCIAHEPEGVSADEIIAIARKAGIVDELDGAPLYHKLCVYKEKGIKYMVGDAIDEEPYISSSLRLLYQAYADVEQGLELAKKAAGAKESVLVYYNPKDEAGLLNKIELKKATLVKIRGKYPLRATFADQMEKNGPTGNIGVKACLALWRAVSKGYPQTTVQLTVAGDCIGSPKNIDVFSGTTIKDIFKYSGLIKEPRYVIFGGPLTGIAVDDFDLPVIPGISGLLALASKPKEKSGICIGCGRCIDACSRGLYPFYIAQYAKTPDIDKLKELNPEKCIGCNACSYICPASVNIAELVQLGKQALQKGEK